MNGYIGKKTKSVLVAATLILAMLVPCINYASAAITDPITGETVEPEQLIPGNKQFNILTGYFDGVKIPVCAFFDLGETYNIYDIKSSMFECKITYVNPETKKTEFEFVMPKELTYTCIENAGMSYEGRYAVVEFDSFWLDNSKDNMYYEQFPEEFFKHPAEEYTYQFTFNGIEYSFNRMIGFRDYTDAVTPIAKLPCTPFPTSAPSPVQSVDPDSLSPGANQFNVFTEKKNGVNCANSIFVNLGSPHTLNGFRGDLFELKVERIDPNTLQQAYEFTIPCSCGFTCDSRASLKEYDGTYAVISLESNFLDTADAALAAGCTDTYLKMIDLKNSIPQEFFTLDAGEFLYKVIYRADKVGEGAPVEYLLNMVTDYGDFIEYTNVNREKGYSNVNVDATPEPYHPEGIDTAYNADSTQVSDDTSVDKKVLKLVKSALTVKKGAKVKIKIKSDNIVNAKYKSVDKKIAKVNKKGVVTGIKKGTTRIKIMAEGSTKSVKVKVK